jgi:hypothetical protein
MPTIRATMASGQQAIRPRFALEAAGVMAGTFESAGKVLGVGGIGYGVPAALTFGVIIGGVIRPVAPASVSAPGMGGVTTRTPGVSGVVVGVAVGQPPPSVRTGTSSQATDIKAIRMAIAARFIIQLYRNRWKRQLKKDRLSPHRYGNL